MSEWQPIETAPRNGSKVLLGFFANDQHQPETGFYRWNKNIAKNKEIPLVRKSSTDPWLDHYSWCSYSSGDSPNRVPTHWMPLEPPQ